MMNPRMCRAVATISLLVFTAGCGTEVMQIRTYPDGAKAAVNGRFVGVTPVNVEYTRGEFQSAYKWTVEKENYRTESGVTTPRIAPGRIVGAIFTLGILMAFRNPQYIPPVTVELQYVEPIGHTRPGVSQGTVEQRLKKIEALHDKGLISDQEYKRLRSDALDELRSE